MRTLAQITDEICGIICDDTRFRSDILRILSENCDADRAELKDWRELGQAVAQRGLPPEYRTRQVWPNDWHQDCAMVAWALNGESSANTGDEPRPQRN